MEGSKEEFINGSKEYEVIIEDQNHCCLCGSKLIFKHHIDYLHLRVREDADCDSCGIRLKTKEHGMQ
jgi:DNA-directed RNA polymerase subunit RPC12/RpoP